VIVSILITATDRYIESIAGIFISFPLSRDLTCLPVYLGVAGAERTLPQPAPLVIRTLTYYFVIRAFTDVVPVSLPNVSEMVTAFVP
jgi:hypothetical protein